MMPLMPLVATLMKAVVIFQTRIQVAKGHLQASSFLSMIQTIMNGIVSHMWRIWPLLYYSTLTITRINRDERKGWSSALRAFLLALPL